MKTKIALFLLWLLSVVQIAHAEIEVDIIDETIQSLIQKQITDNRVSVEQQYNSNSKMTAIRSKKEDIKAITLEKFDPKFSSFRAQVLYNDNKVDFISGKYISFIMVPVASNYIKIGDTVQKSDIITKKVRLDKMQKGYATEFKEVVGMQAKKYIAAGNMFKINDISMPPVLKNNDPVNIVYSSGAINLKTTGVALGAGAVGDMIKVKNVNSGAVLLGQIINKNTVRVGGE